MRDFKGMKRQRGRNRGGGGGGKPQHNANRSFDSNGPEGIKVRGAAQGVFEKYTQLARDASSAGDRVLAENYLQHAEHYYRVVRAMQPLRPVSEIIGKEGYSGGFDIDFEAEPDENAVETNEAPEASSDNEGGDQQQRDRNFDNNNGGRRDGGYQDRPRFENRDRQDRDRQDRGEGQAQGSGQGQGQGQGRRDRWRDRDDRPRDDRPRDDRPRDDRPRDDRPRDDRPRDDRPRDDRPREDRPPREDRVAREGGAREGGERPERNFDREDRPRRERFDREPREASVEAAAPAVRDDEPASPRLRGQDGAVSEAPAFLSRGPAAAPSAPAGDDAEAPKPRRGRPRKIVASEGDI